MCDELKALTALNKVSVIFNKTSEKLKKTKKVKKNK